MGNIFEIGFVLVVLVASIICHEIAHGVAALFFGDDTAKRAGRITLNPISHIDPLGSIIMPAIGLFLGGFIIAWAKPVPFNPANFNRNPRLGLFSVAVSGVATNFVIAVIVALLIRVFGGHENIIFGQLLVQVVFINILLGIFNLIPIPPLDGSKVVYAIFNLSSEQQGKIESVIGGFTGFFILMMLLFLGVLGFVFQGAYFITKLFILG